VLPSGMGAAMMTMASVSMKPFKCVLKTASNKDKLRPFVEHRLS